MICANRTDEPGFFTSCVAACGKCLCGKAMEAAEKRREATQGAAGGPELHRVLSVPEISSERTEENR